MASTIASTLCFSRPSEKFGTHSTMVCIREKNRWRKLSLQASPQIAGGRSRRLPADSVPETMGPFFHLTGSCGFGKGQQFPHVRNQVADFERFDQERNLVRFQETAGLGLRHAGKREKKKARQLRAAPGNPPGGGSPPAPPPPPLFLSLHPALTPCLT